MKRTPLQRKSPMKRSAIKPKRPKVEDTRKGADFDRLVWMRQQPCCACDAPPPCHAHHFIGKLKGMALKAPDSETMPLCLQCHKNLHEKLGMFRVMDRGDMKSWQWAKISHYRLLYQRFLSHKLAQAISAGKLARGVSDELDRNESHAVGLIAELTDT